MLGCLFVFMSGCNCYRVEKSSAASFVCHVLRVKSIADDFSTPDSNAPVFICVVRSYACRLPLISAAS